MGDINTHKRKHFNLIVPFEDSEPVILKILREIKPEWPREKLEFRNFSEGISNKLIGCMLQNGSEKDLIMFRLYGNLTELFIDRQQELLNVEFLHSRGYAPKLHATFENGYCCGFITGRTLETEEMSNTHFSKLIAINLARLHAIQLPDEFKTDEPCAFTTMEKFLRVLPKRFDDDVKQTRLECATINHYYISIVFPDWNLLCARGIYSPRNLPISECHRRIQVYLVILIR